MYIVIYKRSISNLSINKFADLFDAQEFVKDLVREGITDVTLTQAIPFRLKIDVEF